MDGSLLRDAGERDAAFLIGPRFELSPQVLGQAGPGVFGVGFPAKNDLSTVERPARQGLDHDRDFGFRLGPQRDRRQGPEKQRRQREGAQESTSNPGA